MWGSQEAAEEETVTHQGSLCLGHAWERGVQGCAQRFLTRPTRKSRAAPPPAWPGPPSALCPPELSANTPRPLSARRPGLWEQQLVIVPRDSHAWPLLSCTCHPPSPVVLHEIAARNQPSAAYIQAEGPSCSF